MSMLGGLGLSTLPSYAALQQQGLNSGGDALSRSLQFGASLYHDTAERKKDRKAQEEARKKAQKEQRKAQLTSLGISAGAGIAGGAALGALSAPGLAPAAVAAENTATQTAGQVASQVPAQSAINTANTIAGTALDLPTTSQASGFIDSALSSPNAVGSLTQTQAPITPGGFSGNAGLPVPDASTAGINAARTSGIGSQFPSNTYGGSNIGNLPTPKVGDVGSQQYLFGKTLPGSIGTGALLGLANAFAPGVLSTAASLPGQSAQLGLQAANTGLGYARLGEQSRQFDAAEAGRDRRLGFQESGRDRRLGVTEQGRSDRAADTLALGRDNLALDQQGLEERRRQFDVGEQGRNTRQQTGIDASRSLAEFSEQGRNNRLNLTEQGRNERANPFYGLGVGPGNTLSEIGVPTPEGGLLGPQNTVAQAAMAQKLYGNQGLRPADSGEITPRDEARNKLDASRQISDLLQTIGNPKTRKELMQENPNLLGQLEALTTDLGQSYNVKTNVSADEAFGIIKNSLDNGDIRNAEQQLKQYSTSIGDPVKIQQLQDRIDKWKKLHGSALRQIGVDTSAYGID